MNKDRVEEFNVDDVVIAHSLHIDVHLNGVKGIIIEPIQYTESENMGTGAMRCDYRYGVYITGHGTIWFKPENLRKPPEEFDAATLQEAADLIARLTRVHAFEKVGKA